MIGTIVLQEVRHIEKVDLRLPDDCFTTNTNLNRRIYFDKGNNYLLNRVTNWFTAIANNPIGIRDGTPAQNALYNTPGTMVQNYYDTDSKIGPDVANNLASTLLQVYTPPVSVLGGDYYNYPHNIYPSQYQVPIVVTLCNSNSEEIVKNLPISYFQYRLTAWVNPQSDRIATRNNGRKGMNLDLSLRDIELEKSFITICADRLEYGISGQEGLPDPPNGTTYYYNGPYNLHFQFYQF